MHDTLPVRKKYFKQSVRVVGHECVRMEKPQAFAEVLLAEDKGWAAAQVKELWDKGNNSAVALEKSIPVHMVYFTAVADDKGKVETFADVYGLDRKLAAAMFGNANGFPPPPPEPPKSQRQEADATPVNRSAGRGDFMQSMQGFFGDRIRTPICVRVSCWLRRVVAGLIGTLSCAARRAPIATS